MASQPEELNAPFKDYYQILHLHPDADAWIVDRAYWHLARLYNAAAPSDTSAKAKLDDLNEAYGVLGSPSHRKDYDRVRDAVLGQGALPAPPEPEPGPEPEPTPLAVMAKQRPRRREDTQPQRSNWPRLNIRRLSVLTRQSALSALIVLVLVSAALLAGANLAAVVALLAIGVALTAVLLLRKLLALPMPTLRLPTIGGPHLRERRPARLSIDPDTLHQSTNAMLGRWREGADEPSTSESPAPSPHEEPSPDNPNDQRGPVP